MMQLHEIYGYMEAKYAYFARGVNKSWRNSVRHNLSLNECFVKAGRGTNGKGNYWEIHRACVAEFVRGNFRRKSFKQLIKAHKMATASGAAQQSGAEQQRYLPVDYSLNIYSNIKSISAMIPAPMPQIGGGGGSFQYGAGGGKMASDVGGNTQHQQRYRPY
jgi:hypothetical protein